MVLTKENIIHQLHRQCLADTARDGVDNPTRHQSAIAITDTAPDQADQVYDQRYQHDWPPAEFQVGWDHDQSPDAVAYIRV